MQTEKPTNKKLVAYLIILSVISLIVNGYSILAGGTADTISLLGFSLIVLGLILLLIAYVRAKNQRE